MSAEPTQPAADLEASAIFACVHSMEKLGDASRDRVLEYLKNRYSYSLIDTFKQLEAGIIKENQEMKAELKVLKEPPK